MSTSSMQQSLARNFADFPFFQLPDGALSGTAAEVLIAASGILPSDRVLVIGRNLADYLIGLARKGCISATGALPDNRYLRTDDADVVWITCVCDVEAQLDRALCNEGPRRRVIVELPGVGDGEGLQRIVRRLRTRGLVHCACHRAASRLLVTASRPEWLCWVA